MSGRRIRTAPLHNRVAPALSDEVTDYEKRLTKRSARLHHEVSEAWLEGATSSTKAGKVSAAVREVFKQMELDVAAPKLTLGLYLARKLKVCAEAGVLDPRMDVELVMLREIWRQLN